MIYAFIIVTFVMLIVIEIFTVLFRMTGISEKRARFQVISMLTAVGFTTSESETMLNNSLRRRISQMIILFGYSSTVTLISLFVNIYTHKITLEDVYTVVLYCLALLLLVRIRFIKIAFDKSIESIADRYLNRRGSNKLHTLSHYNDNMLVELTILNSVPILDTPLLDLNLKQFNIQILNIERKGFNIVNPNGLDILTIGDKILVFGNEKEIRKSFKAF